MSAVNSAAPVGIALHLRVLIVSALATSWITVALTRHRSLS